jgi:hypothetical protein
MASRSRDKLVLGKRLTGLISYYKGSRQDLMPAVASDEVIRVPFSSFSQGAYSKVRLDEIEIEMKKKDKAEGGLGDVWGEVYDIGKMEKSSNYRMGSRQMCNFAFPTTVTRPRARNSEEEEMENVEDGEILETSPDIPTDSPVEAAAYDFPKGWMRRLRRVAAGWKRRPLRERTRSASCLLLDAFSLS